MRAPQFQTETTTMCTDFHSRNAAAARRQAGMSLAEVMFASAIFAIILISAMVAYDRSNRMFTQGVETSDLQQTTRVAFEKLLSEVRMAGFDYDRDGSPSNGEQQPDEQIEFAGVSAITIRGNLDYFTDIEAQHGLEEDYDVDDKFETVTTGNDEIVTFALKSANDAVNIQKIEFYADVAQPRASYGGGDPESLVTIGSTTAGEGYDLCDDANGCSDPPYTLYRIALERDGTPGTPVPIADNIHALYFTYYTTTTQDTVATVTESGASPKRVEHGAVGGLGQYDPDDPGGTANFEDRGMRGDIRAIHVELTGTTQNKYYERGGPDDSQKRTYTLQTLVVPRNFGHQGAEDPHLGPPNAPGITSVCTGHCGVAHVSWTPSTTGSPVDSYYVCYDTDEDGAYANCIDASLNLESDVSAGLVPGQTYFFKVKAQNSEGQSLSNALSRTIRNNTQPALPGRFEGRGTPTGVELVWSRPSTNTSAFDDLLCTGSGSTNGTNIPSSERIHYTVWRSTNPNFTPGGADSEQAYTTAANNQASSISYVDNATNKPPTTKGPAACVNYYYRIQTSDFCATNATWNEGNNAAIGTNPGYLPALADPAIGPYMMSPGTPSTPNKPVGLVVDMASSACNSGNNKCSINLDWSAVTGGTDSSAMAVNTYRIKRWRQLGTGARVPYPIDAALPDGYIYTGALTNGTTFTDNDSVTGTTPQPPVKASGGVDYIYYYTVEAQNCTVLGAPSDEAKYPTCYFDLTQVAATGALTGNGSLGNEWVLAGGDKLTVSHATKVITEVTFTVMAPNGSTVTSLSGTDSIAPFELNWSDLADGQIYTVVIAVKDVLGCIQSPILTRYIKDQAPALCYTNLETYTWGTETAPSGQTVTRTVTLNLKNDSTFEDMTLKAMSFTFADSAECLTGNPAHNFTIDSITYGGVVFDGTDRTAGTHTFTFPATPAQTVALNSGTNAAYPIAITFSYRGDRCGDISLSNPFSSICLTYQLASEPNVNKICNIVGTETNNPNACN